MKTDLTFWQQCLGHPEDDYAFSPVVTPVKVYDYPDFICEYYTQQNGPATSQRVMMLVPKDATAPLPAVVVPFYFPEAMMGEEPATHDPLPAYKGIEMMLHLVRHGYVTISADAYHLTYAPDLPLPRNDFSRWAKTAARLNADHPRWSGVGKLVADTRLLLDMLCADPRVDNSRLGIAGHSLGGKMAFYTGCLDPRVKVILASDFGLRWEQTNWDDEWYWGKKRIAAFQAQGLTHADLLAASDCKPLALLAGQYDNDDSLTMLQDAGYAEDSPPLCFINHASGHRPPQWALDIGYHFLDHYLK